MQKHNTLLLLILLLYFNPLKAQKFNIDSLKNVLNTETQDSNKLKALILLGEYYEGIALDSCIPYYDKVINTAKQKKMYSFAIDGLRYKSMVINEQGKFPEAKKLMQEALDLSIQKKLDKSIAVVSSNFGILYRSQGDYENALKMHFQSLKIKEQINDKKGISASCNNIGVIYQDQKKYNEALKYHLRSLELKTELKEKKNMVYTLNNIGLIYYHKQIYDTALVYLNKALVLADTLKNQNFRKFTLDNIVLVQTETGMYTEAETNASEALAIAKKMGNKYQETFTLQELASLYLKTKKYTKAIETAREGYNIALATGNKGKISETAYILAESYGFLNNFENAYNFFKIHKAYSDSIFSKEKDKEINLITIQRKDLENENLQKEKLVAESELEKKNIIIWTTIIFIILLAGLVVVVFNSRQKERKAKLELKQKNDEILEKNAILEQQKEEIITQAENLEQANHEVSAQKELLEQSHKLITSSIQYASKIQEAALPTPQYISNIFNEYFILFKPRDVVSGDFYFVKKLNSYAIIAAADCTGHGVPGALMSMLGMALLNEIIRKEEINEANLALEELRIHLKKSLQQTGRIGERTDGMDIAFAAINFSTKELSFAGANNPLWLFRNNELIVLQPDRMPIGVYVRELPFKVIKEKLCENDRIYMFSDGYISQFGGIKDEKFKTQRFKKLISEIHQKNMCEQSIILENTLNEWKGFTAQTDDILVLGLKIDF